VSNLAKLLESKSASSDSANAANTANPTDHQLAISTISSFSTLEDRIRQMAARWQYSDAELADALTRAAQNPAGWLMCVEDDERKQLWKL